MKIRFQQLVVLFSFVLLSSATVAQSTTKKFSVGIRAGANFSQLADLSYQTPRLDVNGLPVLSGGSVVYDFFQQNDTRSVGLVGGVFARFGNWLYIQPELLFSMKGGQIDLVRQGLATQSFNVKVGTVDLPLLLGVRLGPLRLNAGPMASLRVLNGKLGESLKQYGSQPLAETVKQVTLGYQAGIGLSMAGMQLDLRHEAGLPLSSSDASGNAAIRPSIWQLTVGFGL